MLFKCSVLLKVKGSALGPKALWVWGIRSAKSQGQQWVWCIGRKKNKHKSKERQGPQSKVDQRRKREKIRQRGTQRPGQVVSVNL